MNRLSKLNRLTLLCVASLALLSSAFAGVVKLNGATTLFLSLVKPNLEAVKAETGSTLDATGSTSVRGFNSIKTGEVEIVMSSETLARIIEIDNSRGGNARIEDYEEIPLKDMPIVFVVNARNTAPKLDENQLRNIYLGELRNWKEVGGQDQPIAVISEKEHSTNNIQIRAQLLKGAGLPIKRTTFVDNVRLMVSGVAELETAFGATPLFYVDTNVRIISDYTLMQHQCLIIRKNASPEVRKVAAALKARSS